MNNIIKNEIEKVEKDFIVEWDGNSFTVKGVKIKSDQMLIGNTYNIVLRDYVVNEPPNFTLSSNWNRGNKFYSINLKATVKDIKGKMVLIDAIDEMGNIYKNMYIPSGGIDSFE